MMILTLVHPNEWVWKRGSSYSLEWHRIGFFVILNHPSIWIQLTPKKYIVYQIEATRIFFYVIMNDLVKVLWEKIIEKEKIA